MSELKVLNLANLQDVDLGKADTMFSHALRNAVLDCLNRPTDDRVRTVTLTVKLKPVCEVFDTSVSCEGATGSFLCKSKIPDFETPEVDFGIKENGVLVFNPYSPRNHNQLTMFESEEE